MGKAKGMHVRIRMWFGGYKQACATNTLKSLILNMLIGVTEGFEYRMRCVHAHFPINCIIPPAKDQIDVKNFLGGKQIKHVDMIKGVTCEMNPDVKDERKFLDGIFVSKKDVWEKREE